MSVNSVCPRWFFRLFRAVAFAVVVAVSVAYVAFSKNDIQGSLSGIVARISAYSHAAARQSELDALASQIEKDSTELERATEERKRLQERVQKLLDTRSQIIAQLIQSRDLSSPVFAALGGSRDSGLIRVDDRLYQRQDIQRRAHELFSRVTTLEEQLDASESAIATLTNGVRELDNRIDATRRRLDSQRAELSIHLLELEGKEAQRALLTRLHRIDTSSTR